MADSLQPWNEADLPALLTLEQTGPRTYRNRHGDANLNGRSYGGQSLGQALMAASLSAPPDRRATAMQFMFLQGSMPDRAIDFEVTPLQDGKRFSSRHVRGTQGGRMLFDAQVSFALPLDAPEHQAQAHAQGARPEDLPALPDLPLPWESGLRRLGGYSLREKACIDFRVPDVQTQVAPEAATTRLRYWLKARYPLPATPGMHASAFAYLSDWWLNFSSLGAHVKGLEDDRRLYVASLNHCIWFHRPFAPDDWLYVDTHSPCAAEGRGLSIASVHDRSGTLVASATQECLMAYA
ncbi:acyl-CoA thioesterase [Variovorax ginsengisoli]|uniref:Acyl-CoA thioesterase-2 n=1 Tax=Variovorax ginsengisoli TaxID=363844 RepID=A0ABT9SB20_9BURK|nr:acyl-CoA thioesterase domain-containing protein [Variovorax ginsengisoli]MDP9900961.1 acyl-CoA thioesterase-2 [Variovorax ginsengisoli]